METMEVHMHRADEVIEWYNHFRKQASSFFNNSTIH